MGRKSRSISTRTHKHSDLAALLPTYDENSLLAYLSQLKVPPFLLILDGVQDPYNLGACLRTADAAGVHAVIAPKDRSVLMNDTVRTVACGGAERVPFVPVTNLSRIMSQLKESGIWFVGTEADAPKMIYEIDLTGPLAIVMGSEGKGLRELTAKKCDFLACLPMAGSVESLNVSVATGICLFEALRQRLGK